MTFKEFNLAVMRNPVLGRLLPMECRKTYPRLELDGETLCACFVGFRMKPVPGGAEAQAPVYYLKITYPRCAVRAFVKLSRRNSEAHRMTPQSPEMIQNLVSLCDRVLQEYEEKAGDLGETIAAYNGLLDKILEPEQLAVLNQMAAL